MQIFFHFRSVSKFEVSMAFWLRVNSRQRTERRTERQKNRQTDVMKSLTWPPWEDRITISTDSYGERLIFLTVNNWTQVSTRHSSSIDKCREDNQQYSVIITKHHSKSRDPFTSFHIETYKCARTSIVQRCSRKTSLFTSDRIKAGTSQTDNRDKLKTWYNRAICLMCTDMLLTVSFVYNM